MVLDKQRPLSFFWFFVKKIFDIDINFGYRYINVSLGIDIININWYLFEHYKKCICGKSKKSLTWNKQHTSGKIKPVLPYSVRKIYPVQECKKMQLQDCETELTVEDLTPF